MVVCSYELLQRKLHSGKVLSQTISWVKCLDCRTCTRNAPKWGTGQAPSPKPQALNINRSASLASLKVAHAFDSRLDDYAIVIHGMAQRMPWPCLRLHVCSEFSVETCSTYSCTSIQA